MSKNDKQHHDLVLTERNAGINDFPSDAAVHAFNVPDLSSVAEDDYGRIIQYVCRDCGMTSEWYVWRARFMFDYQHFLAGFPQEDWDYYIKSYTCRKKSK